MNRNREHLGIAGVLAIIVCGIILLVSGFYALVFFEHTQVSVPLILVAALCAVVIAATISAMRKRPR